MANGDRNSVRSLAAAASAGAEASGAEASGAEASGAEASGGSAALADILAQVSREALQGEDLDAVLRGIVECLAQRLPVAIASIILLNDVGTHFEREVYAGELLLVQPGLGEDWPVTLGAAGRCVRTGEPLLVTDVESDPDYVSGNASVKAEYMVPIRHRSRLHGVLNIESENPAFFTADICAVFDAVALQVAGAIHLARMAEQLEAANRKLQQLSLIDGLTGIANRRRFDEQLEACWARLARERRPLALLLVDADRFKALNDACGHLYGDECLRQLARLCAQFADGEDDLVARYGGEELVLLLPYRDPTAAHAVAEQLRALVELEAMAHPGSTVAAVVTVSIGVAALTPQPGLSPQQLIAMADAALYRAKADGRNRVEGPAAGA